MTSESDGAQTPPVVPPTGYAPPPQPPPGYAPAPYGYAYVQPKPTNGKAIASLVLSIVSLVLCPIVAIAGLIFGYKARAEIRERDEDGDGLALAGIIVGWLGIAYSVFVVLFFALIFAVPIMANGG